MRTAPATGNLQRIVEPASPPPSPDRLADTLAVRERLWATAGPGPFRAPGAGSADARIDLKLWWWQARTAVAARGTDAARARLASVDTPDLAAGTVTDGVARGVRVALEEAISLCEPAPPPPPPEPDDPLDPLLVFEGRELRKRRELLVASGGARLRWSRRGGILFVDRDHGVHAEDCVRFEDRRDRGDLDGFVPDPDERPRLFSPAFLKPVRYEENRTLQRLTLDGRLGRRGDGYPCRMVVSGRPTDARLRIELTLRNEHDDHRLRIRLLGCANPAALATEGAPPPELCLRRGGVFLAVTLVRACGVLKVGALCTPTPDAQCRGLIHHVLHLGGAPWRTPSKE
ncbi:MAG: hypothetical protein IPM29_17755 [Planctomycetes bacterium]|nr:hypothetical protein [Planctomycetota bacterium]